MLTFLKIRNLALVESLIWEPDNGFICVTGETGAGKSVIIGAIRLALGERADKSLIRSGEDQCSVEAIFSVEEISPLHALLAEYGITPCEDGSLTVRRIVSSTANKQFINDSPCTLQLLREAGSLLVDMHGPNDHRSLLSRERQLSLLDSFGTHESLVLLYAQAWNSWRRALGEYEDLVKAETATELELDLLRHQVDEISNANFTKEEVDSLEEKWSRMRNAERLREIVSKMTLLFDSSSESPSLTSLFHELLKASGDLQRFDAGAESWLAPLGSIHSELKEFEGRLEDYAAELGGDPAELNRIEERINLLESLKRKYGPEYEDMEERLQAATLKLERIEHRSELLEEMKARAEECRNEVDALGKKLSAARSKAAPSLAQEIVKHLTDLGFKQSLFEIRLSPVEEPTAHGLEEIEFLFGPNPGEPIRELRLIASSGELARVMLAIKSALAHNDSTPLLVFDEIDSNVGGEIARAVGKKMQELGLRHQVVSITHFPQVAAMAAHHYLVEKNVVAERTISLLREISAEARLEELVRMLGGGGEATLAHARALLDQ